MRPKLLLMSNTKLHIQKIR